MFENDEIQFYEFRRRVSDLSYRGGRGGTLKTGVSEAIWSAAACCRFVLRISDLFGPIMNVFCFLIATEKRQRAAALQRTGPDRFDQYYYCQADDSGDPFSHVKFVISFRAVCLMPMIANS